MNNKCGRMVPTTSSPISQWRTCPKIIFSEHLLLRKVSRIVDTSWASNWWPMNVSIAAFFKSIWPSWKSWVKIAYCSDLHISVSKCIMMIRVVDQSWKIRAMTRRVHEIIYIDLSWPVDVMNHIANMLLYQIEGK